MVVSSFINLNQRVLGLAFVRLALPDFERDLTLFVAAYDSSNRKAVEQILDSGVFGVNVEKLFTDERKAAMTQSWARCFSFITPRQCLLAFALFGVL
jgi:hypothetical protein